MRSSTAVAGPALRGLAASAVLRAGHSFRGTGPLDRRPDAGARGTAPLTRT